MQHLEEEKLSLPFKIQETSFPEVSRIPPLGVVGLTQDTHLFLNNPWVQGTGLLSNLSGPLPGLGLESTFLETHRLCWVGRALWNLVRIRQLLRRKKTQKNRCRAGDQNYLPQFSEITCPNILAGVPYVMGQGKEACTTSSIYHTWLPARCCVLQIPSHLNP